jgi:hypothetical protein
LEQLEELLRLFAKADGKRLSVEFVDGESCNLFIASTTHILEDDTVIAIPLGSDGQTSVVAPGIQFNLREVIRVLDFDTRKLLFG